MLSRPNEKQTDNLSVSLFFSSLFLVSRISGKGGGVDFVTVLLYECRKVNKRPANDVACGQKQTNKQKEKKRKKYQIPFSLHFNFSPTKTKMSCFENENLLSAFRASVKPDGRLIFANDLPGNRPYKILMD